MARGFDSQHKARGMRERERSLKKYAQHANKKTFCGRGAKGRKPGLTVVKKAALVITSLYCHTETSGAASAVHRSLSAPTEPLPIPVYKSTKNQPTSETKERVSASGSLTQSNVKSGLRFYWLRCVCPTSHTPPAKSPILPGWQRRTLGDKAKCCRTMLLVQLSFECIQFCKRTISKSTICPGTADARWLN